MISCWSREMWVLLCEDTQPGAFTAMASKLQAITFSTQWWIRFLRTDDCGENNMRRRCSLRPPKYKLNTSVLRAPGRNHEKYGLSFKLNGWSPRRRFACCSNHRLTQPTETSPFSARLLRRLSVLVLIVAVFQFLIAGEISPQIVLLSLDEIHWGHGLRANNFLAVIY